MPDNLNDPNWEHLANNVNDRIAFKTMLNEQLNQALFVRSTNITNLSQAILNVKLIELLNRCALKQNVVLLAYQYCLREIQSRNYGASAKFNFEFNDRFHALIYDIQTHWINHHRGENQFHHIKNFYVNNLYFTNLNRQLQKQHINLLQLPNKSPRSLNHLRRNFKPTHPEIAIVLRYFQALDHYQNRLTRAAIRDFKQQSLLAIDPHFKTFLTRHYHLKM